jgi:hypothetical protein
MRIKFNAKDVLRAASTTSSFLGRLRRLGNDARETMVAARDALDAIHSAVDGVDATSEPAPTTTSSPCAAATVVSPLDAAAARAVLPADVRREIKRKTGHVLEPKS